ncbi:MAG: viperin family antiviral radical SAM protein [Candidatus Helarchaeota archaeon]
MVTKFRSIQKINIKKSFHKVYTVNFHVWPYCNYKCKFCFAKFGNIKKYLSKNQSINIIKNLPKLEVKKINFAGGEPTLCPYISALIKESKELGLITSIISNSSGINRKFLQLNHNYLDWIGLSIDSSNERLQHELGRGFGNHVKRVIKSAKLIKLYGIKLKINTVITSLNFKENMEELIQKLKPDKWKVFQVLPIKNENWEMVKNLTISRKNFELFVKKHRHLNPIHEENSSMINSYVMIDPKGRFFQNTNNNYFYSEPILKIGIMEAFNQVKFDYDKFIKRGGIYE